MNKFEETFQRWKNGENYWDIVGNPFNKKELLLPLTDELRADLNSYLNNLDQFDEGADDVIPVNTRDLTYNVHPSAIGAKNLEVTLPDTEVVGYSPEYKLKHYASSFDPNGAEEFVDIAGLNFIPNPFKFTRQINEGNYLGAAEQLSPLIGLESNTVGTIANTINFRHLFGEDGILKTYKRLKDSDYSKAALSFGGDLLYALPILDLINNTKNLLELSKNNKNIFNNELTRRVLYNTKLPISYSTKWLTMAFPYNYIKAIVKQTLPNIDNPWWNRGMFKDVFNGHLKHYGVNNDVALDARKNAWLKYLRLSQSGKYKFVENADGSYTNPDAIALLTDMPIFNNHTVPIKQSSLNLKDFVTSAGGNVNGVVRLLSKNSNNNYYGILDIYDTFDLMPGQRINKKIISFLNKSNILHKTGVKIRDVGRRINQDYTEHSRETKLGNLLKRIGNKLIDFNYKDSKLYNTLQNTEVGKFVGAKPFDIHYTIPFSTDLTKTIYGFNFPLKPLDKTVYKDYLKEIYKSRK